MQEVLEEGLVKKEMVVQVDREQNLVGDAEKMTIMSSHLANSEKVEDYQKREMHLKYNYEM